MNGYERIFQDTTVGSMKVAIDCSLNCSLKQFQYICTLLRQLTPDVHFIPSFDDIQVPAGRVDVLKVTLSLLEDLCSLLVFKGKLDKRTLIRKWKGCKRDAVKYEKAIRLLGSYLFEERHSDGPCAILLGRSTNGLFTRYKDNCACSGK